MASIHLSNFLAFWVRIRGVSAANRCRRAQAGRGDSHARASRLRENTGGLHTGKTGRRGQGEEIGRGSRKLRPIFEFPNSRCGRAPGNLDVSSHRILSRRMPGIWSRQSVCAVAYGERNALAATTSEPPGVDQFGHKLAGKCDRDPGTRVAGEREQQDQEVI